MMMMMMMIKSRDQSTREERPELENNSLSNQSKIYTKNQ